MKLYTHLIALLSLAAATAASAHISYTGRNFGSFTGSGLETLTLGSNAVTGNYGWASGTDTNLSDTHKLRAYTFTLQNAAIVSLTFQGYTYGSVTNALALPAFSLYSGLAHVAPAALDHDDSAISTAYNNAILGTNNWDGSFNALGNWKIGSDDGSTFADLSSFTYIGNAADGTSANYGSNPATLGYALDASNNVVSFTNDTIHGDGLADGTVTGTFSLAAGSYSVFVGNDQYFGTNNAGANNTATYGVKGSISVSAVPEPSNWVLLGLSFVITGLLLRHRTRNS
ncbi:MAG: PEP-CTERM sorting domain-containing protein [bacterium]